MLPPFNESQSLFHACEGTPWACSLVASWIASFPCIGLGFRSLARIMAHLRLPRMLQDRIRDRVARRCKGKREPVASGRIYEAGEIF